MRTISWISTINCSAQHNLTKWQVSYININPCKSCCPCNIYIHFANFAVFDHFHGNFYRWIITINYKNVKYEKILQCRKVGVFMLIYVRVVSPEILNFEHFIDFDNFLTWTLTINFKKIKMTKFYKKVSLIIILHVRIVVPAILIF